MKWKSPISGTSDADPVETLADAGDGSGALVTIDGDAHELRAGAGERHHLRHGSIDIGRVGVGLRLHDHRRIATDHHLADSDGDRAAARCRAEELGHGAETSVSGNGRDGNDHGAPDRRRGRRRRGREFPAPMSRA